MSAVLWAASAEEINDLLFWVDDHPEDVDPLSRDILARWLGEFRRGANGFPCSAVPPESEMNVLSALIDDWVEVLAAHGEEFLTELRTLDESKMRSV